MLGTGLGLWITKSLCERMNGKIAVKSKVGRGTNFIITLKTKSTTTLPSLTQEMTENRMKLLIVEDDKFIAQIIARYIQDSNLPIEIVGVVENGLEAFNFYKEYLKRGERIDVITTDLEMPVMGGKASCKLIRQFELENRILPAKIFIISANCLEKEVMECTEKTGLIGADGFLRKPLKKTELLTLLARLNMENTYPFSSLKNVLIVDDDAFNQKLLEEMLNKQNVKTILAPNGKQALETCQSIPNDISLVIMDCEMPVMDGWEATLAIRSYYLEKKIACPPIYGLTGYTSHEFEEKCKAAGMSKVLKKPIGYHELIQNLKLLTQN